MKKYYKVNNQDIIAVEDGNIIELGSSLEDLDELDTEDEIDKQVIESLLSKKDKWIEVKS